METLNILFESPLGIVIFISAYLLGSIPFGFLIAKIFLGYDIRTVGSGNIGMTNMVRTGGKIPGIATFVFDVGKGSLAVFIAIYFIISPKPKSITSNPKPNKKFELYAVPVVGFYDGMFGPGAGSFFAMTGVMLKKLEIIQATILAKPLNFASNIAGFIVFFSFGHIAFLIGLLMMMGQMIGAFFGTHYLLKANPLIIRFLIVIISISMLIKYMLSLS
mgnify:CR=1 FL=1